MKSENKRKFALWIYPETMEQVKALYEDDNCKSQSEYIEKAVEFYNGYVLSNKKNEFLSNTLTSSITSGLESFEKGMRRLLFKYAVEMSMMMHVVAATSEIDPIALERLRGRCVRDVKKSNGSIRFNDAIDFQNS